MKSQMKILRKDTHIIHHARLATWQPVSAPHLSTVHFQTHSEGSIEMLQALNLHLSQSGTFRPSLTKTYVRHAPLWLLLATNSQRCLQPRLLQLLWVLQKARKLATSAAPQGISSQWPSRVRRSEHTKNASKNIKPNSTRHRYDRELFETYICHTCIENDSLSCYIEAYQQLSETLHHPELPFDSKWPQLVSKSFNALCGFSGVKRLTPKHIIWKQMAILSHITEL